MRFASKSNLTNCSIPIETSFRVSGSLPAVTSHNFIHKLGQNVVAILYDCTIRRLASVYKPRFKGYVAT